VPPCPKARGKSDHRAPQLCQPRSGHGYIPSFPFGCLLDLVRLRRPPSSPPESSPGPRRWVAPIGFTPLLPSHSWTFWGIASWASAAEPEWAETAMFRGMGQGSESPPLLERPPGTRVVRSWDRRCRGRRGYRGRSGRRAGGSRLRVLLTSKISGLLHAIVVAAVDPTQRSRQPWHPPELPVFRRMPQPLGLSREGPGERF
jgi:hypothetical protein